MIGNRKPHLLVVDDVRSTAQIIKSSLEKAGYSVTIANSGKEALEEVNKLFVDLLVLDESIPDMNGSSILRRCRERFPEMEAVFVTGQTDLLQYTAPNVVQPGAYGLVIKGTGMEDRLVAKVRQALEKTEISRANRHSRHSAKRMAGKTAIIGSNPAFLKGLDRALHVASTDSYVLLQGETGTGKGLFANYIHQLSPRRSHPFISVNVSALTPELAEAELFGSRKGAYTSADRDIKGFFELADKGTLFLDEIGHLPTNLQIKLLTALERHKTVNGKRQKFWPVRAEKEQWVDVRIISATDQNLEQLMRQGNFSEALFHRLNVFPISVPSLRERREDIQPLAMHYLAEHGRESGKDISGITAEAVERLESYAWPGNIRELTQLMERIIVLFKKGEITAALIDEALEPAKSTRKSDSGEITGSSGAASRVSEPSGHVQVPQEQPVHEQSAQEAALDGATQTAKEKLKDRKRELDKEHYKGILEKYAGNVRRASVAEEISHNTFYRVLENNEIDAIRKNAKGKKAGG